MAMSLITCLRLPIIEWAHPVVVYRTPARLSTSQPSHVWDRSRLWKGQPSEGHQRSPPQSSLSLRPYVRDQWGNRVKIAQRWEGKYEGFRYTYTHTTLHTHTYIHYTYYTTHTLHLHYVRDQWGNRVKIAQRWEGKYGGFRYSNYTYTHILHYTHIHYTYYTTHTTLHIHYTYTLHSSLI